MIPPPPGEKGGVAFATPKFYWNTKAAEAKAPAYIQWWFCNPSNRLVVDLGVSLPKEYVKVVRQRLGLGDYGPVFVEGTFWNGSYHDPWVWEHPVLIIFYQHRKRVKHPFSRAKKIARVVKEVYEEFRRAQWEATNARFNKWEGD